jgi:histidinol dehydrogenase
MAAAAVANVDRLFAIGGAGAVAAMAFGTETVPRVDRIVGPGNAFVAEAKLQLSGSVAIDSPAGPSELLVVADETTDVRGVAMEMVAQAEHDPRACCVAVVLGAKTAERVALALCDAARSTARADVVARSLASNGAIVIVDSIEQAIAFAKDYAPEHLLVATSEPECLAERVRNAGTIFIGLTASVAFGDYMTGANHVLPTGGLARCYSGLSTLDFVRWTTYQRVSRDAAASLALDVSTFANAEGLPGHADAALHAGGER